MPAANSDATVLPNRKHGGTRRQAVIKSPTPELSTVKAANEVAPEMEAIATVPPPLMSISDRRAVFGATFNPM